MKDLGFFLGFFVILIILAISTAGGHGIFSGAGTATSTNATSGSQGSTSAEPIIRSAGTVSPTQTKSVPTTPKLTPAQIEQRVANIYRELDKLTEALRVAKLHEPASPYAGLVDLRIGNARSTNPEQEYINIFAHSNNKNPINISDWYVESYVTEERAAIPLGDRVLTRWRYPQEENILLEPGETAYLLTGESPINTSFHENICTGYLETENDFYPSLSRRCPSPRDEMKRFADIALDNDTCYDYVARLSYCAIPDEDTYADADLTGACRRFLDTTLNHDDCVLKHRYDPFFDDVGYWHIYFERSEELWRYKREILRLMDENDRVIDVLEY